MYYVLCLYLDIHTLFLDNNYFQILCANIDCRSTEAFFAKKLSQYTRMIYITDYEYLNNIFEYYSDFENWSESQSRFVLVHPVVNDYCNAQCYLHLINLQAVSRLSRSKYL